MKHRETTDYVRWTPTDSLALRLFVMYAHTFIECDEKQQYASQWEAWFNSNFYTAFVWWSWHFVLPKCQYIPLCTDCCYYIHLRTVWFTSIAVTRFDGVEIFIRSQLVCKYSIHKMLSIQPMHCSVYAQSTLTVNKFMGYGLAKRAVEWNKDQMKRKCEFPLSEWNGNSDNAQVNQVRSMEARITTDKNVFHGDPKWNDIHRCRWVFSMFSLFLSFFLFQCIAVPLHSRLKKTRNS